MIVTSFGLARFITAVIDRSFLRRVAADSTRLCLVRHPTPSGGQPDKMMRKKSIFILGTARFVTAEYEWLIMMRPDGTLIFLEKTIRKRIAFRLKSRDTF